MRRLIAAAAVVVLAAGCSGEPSENAAPPSEATVTVTATATATVTVTAPQPGASADEPLKLGDTLEGSDVSITVTRGQARP